MARNKWRLSADLQRQLGQVTADLNAELESLQGIYDEHSERWQDSDKGNDVDTWLRELDELSNLLTDIDMEVR